MKRVLIVVVLAIFCISNFSYAQEASQEEISKTRGGILLLLLPSLLKAGTAFITSFIDKAAESIVAKRDKKKASDDEESSSSDDESAVSTSSDKSASLIDVSKVAAPEQKGTDKQVAQVSGGKVNLALLVKVWLVKGNTAQAVDPETSAFKLGDLIYLEVAATTPGVIEAYNSTPKGKVQKLGSWMLNSVGSVRIPNDPKDYIEFYEDTGEDILEVRFYPCMTAIAKRSLRVKNTSGVILEVASQLAVCGSQISATAADGQKDTRSLRVKQGVVSNTGFAVNTYNLDKLSSSEPIVYTLKLRSQ